MKQIITCEAQVELKSLSQIPKQKGQFFFDIDDGRKKIIIDGQRVSIEINNSRNFYFLFLSFLVFSHLA